jgi:hypothetical protein
MNRFLIIDIAGPPQPILFFFSMKNSLEFILSIDSFTKRSYSCSKKDPTIEIKPIPYKRIQSPPSKTA